MQKSPPVISFRRVLGKLVVAFQPLLFLVSAPVFASALIPQVGWTLKSVDSEETSSLDGAATNAFDGDVSTIWHTQWQGSSPRPPHWIDIDLGTVHDLDGFRYLPRQDGGVDGRVEIYAFYVSMDGVTWGSVVAAGTFRNNAQEQEVSFALTQGRYIRFQALTEENGQPWTSVAELNVLGAASSGVDIEPNGVIDTPGDGATVEVGGALNFTGSGSDPDSNALLSYRWTFGDPTVADLTVEDPHNVMFNTPGTHTVTLTVVDHLGLADSTPATIPVTVNAPSATSAIPPTGSSLLPETSYPQPMDDLVSTLLALDLIATGPIVISGESDVIISGKHITNPNGSCIEILNDASNVVIENSIIGPCRDRGIYILQSSHVTITGNYIHDTGTEGVMSYQSNDIAVDSNHIEEVESGYEMWTTSIGNLSFTNNYIKNVRRARNNDAGGNVAMIAFVHGGGVRVNNNIAINVLGESAPEDLVNIYKSDGKANDRIQVNNNQFYGGGPSLSGGGIILGDDGGSYQEARNNILVNPGMYGISISEGHHNILANNKVFSDDQRSFTSLGIIMGWIAYTRNSECYSHEVSNNEITFWQGTDWTSTPFLSPYWKWSECEVSGWGTNKFDTGNNQPANLDATIVPEEIRNLY